MKRWFRYERPHEELAPHHVLWGRLAASALLSATIILASLAAGMLGYHQTEGLPWLDALLNASMILGGMGPVSPIVTPGGKIFASVYALYCGVLILLNVGLLMAPVAHRVLHQFHMDRARLSPAGDDEDDEEE